MRRLQRWTISSHATASPAMQRRTRLLTIWASSNQRSRELLAISPRPRCETRYTPRLTSHDDYVVVPPKVRSGPASHYEARNCSRGGNHGSKERMLFILVLKNILRAQPGAPVFTTP